LRRCCSPGWPNARAEADARGLRVAGELELAPAGWTLLNDWGKGVRQPTAAFFRTQKLWGAFLLRPFRPVHAWSRSQPGRSKTAPLQQTQLPSDDRSAAIRRFRNAAVAVRDGQS